MAGFSTVARALGKDAATASTLSLAANVDLGDPAMYSSPFGASALLRAALDVESLAGLGPGAATERALAWLAAIEDPETDESNEPFAEILPDAAWFQARLIMERDEPGLRGDALTGGAFGTAYARIRSKLGSSRDSGPALEAVLDAIWNERRSGQGLPTGPIAPILRSERWIPPKTTLSATHRYALDVFFSTVRHRGAVEIGPIIRNIAAGIVVASADDWRGGDKPSLYSEGGLSPRAGNGVIVYSPDEGRYYAYFHMNDISVRTGDIIGAGLNIGHGGNTGVNARKKGHGGHLHVEIHETGRRVWSAYELRDFLIGLR